MSGLAQREHRAERVDVHLEPAASQAVRNQSRTCLSSGPSVNRRTPPFGVAPNFAVSWMVSHSLAESICRLDAILVMRFPDWHALHVHDAPAAVRQQRGRSGQSDGEIGHAFDRDRIGRSQPARRKVIGGICRSVDSNCSRPSAIRLTIAVGITAMPSPSTAMCFTVRQRRTGVQAHRWKIRPV